MLKNRVIPCLLLRDGGLVKTEKFKKYKYIGDPINALRIFNEKEVDELIFMDIDASRHNKEPNWETLKDLASECFMPLSYAGGVKNLKQIEMLLKIGIEKVGINHQSLTDLSLLKEASRQFGSSSIIGGIDVKNSLFGKTYVYDHVKGKSTSLDPVNYAQTLEAAGVGEIFLNSVDRDGSYSGYDLDLINKVSHSLSIPLIACGGASSYSDLNAAIAAGASAVAAGSIFVYHGPHRAVLISYPTAIQLESILHE